MCEYGFMSVDVCVRWYWFMGLGSVFAYVRVCVYKCIHVCACVFVVICVFGCV